jgi:hypothetical protein
VGLRELRSLLKRLDDYRVRETLKKLTSEQKRRTLECAFEEHFRCDREAISMFEGFDREFHTDYTSRVRFIYQQLRCIRMHYYDFGSLEAATAASKFLFELGSLDKEFRRSPELYLPDLFQGTISDLFDVGLEYFRHERLEKVLEYPRSLSEFYLRYSQP